MKRKSKVLAALALAAAVVVPLSSCSSPSSGQAGNEKVTLSMWGFSPLYKPQVKEYEKLHPNVTIQQKIGDYDASHQALLTALNANKGPDIAQIAIDYAPEFTAVPAAFVDLRTLGAAKIKKDYLDWRWQGGVASNGSVVGVPTDVGGLAVAYRTDLFKKAGLPTSPAAVSKLMATWPEYIATGQKYTAATGKPFLDSATQLFQDASDQGASKYVSAKGKYIYENNSVIKNAWSYATQAATDKITGGLAPDSPQWYSALANGGVATVLAPSWMLSQIESAAPKTKGLWSVATMPGGGGNNGGSFLAIPKSSPNAAAAYKFITWLEAPAQQLAAFKATADFPAIPSLYSNAAVQNYTAPFFSNASIGKVYVDSVEKYTEHPVGAKDRILEQEFQNGVGRVEKNGQSVSSSWAQTLAAAKRDQ